MKKTRKLVCCSLVLLMMSSLFAVLANEHSGILRIKIFKVGKADAYLLRTDHHAVLIDAGEEDDAQDIIAYLEEKDIDSLDYLVLTHFDKRSIGGAPELLQNVKVGKVMMPTYPKSNNLMNLMEIVLEEKSVERVSEKTSFGFEGAEFTVYPAEQKMYQEDEDNDFSLVVSAIHGENSFFFSGDIMSQRIEEMLQANLLTPHKVIKMPCHGQNIEGLDVLLDAVKPDIAIIPASDKNPPAGAVLSNLEGRNIRWYSPMFGSITLTSDGFGVTVKQNIK